MRDCHGEHLFVELADGTICSLPEWRFRPECPGFLVGAPLIAVEALVALRDLIASLHTAAECAKGSRNNRFTLGQSYSSRLAGSNVV